MLLIRRSPGSSPLRIRRASVGGAVVAIVAATVAGGAQSQYQHPARQHTSVKAARDAQAELLAEIQRGFVDLRIAESRIGPPPEPYDASDDIRPIPGAVWIFYKIRASDHFAYKRGKWQALVTSGLLRDVSATRNLPPVVGHSFTIIWPDGSDQYDASSTLYKPEREPADRVDVTQLRELVRGGADKVRVKLVELRVSRPLGRLAPEVVVRSDDPRAFVSRLYDNVWDIVGTINGETGQPLTEGAYIETRDANGTLVDVSAYSTRTGQGTGATNPAYGGTP